MTEAPRATIVQPSVMQLGTVPRICPDIAEAVGDCYSFLSSVVDPAAVELCRLRVAQITGGGAQTVAAPPPGLLSEAQLRDLAEWRDSEQFDAKQKACLEYAEYFCYSALSVTDEHIENLNPVLPPEEILGLTVALWASDSFYRLSNFLEIVQHEEPAR